MIRLVCTRGRCTSPATVFVPIDGADDETLAMPLCAAHAVDYRAATRRSISDLFESGDRDE